MRCFYDLIFCFAFIASLTLAGCCQECSRSLSAEGVQDPPNKMNTQTTGLQARIDSVIPVQLTKEELAAGWILLFDGETTFGWNTDKAKGWKVVGNCLSASGTDAGMLYTTSEFGNFELSFDVQLAQGAKIETLLRASPESSDLLKRCHRIEMAGVSQQDSSSNMGGEKLSLKLEADRWHTAMITAKEGEIKISVDGNPPAEWKGNLAVRRGHIAFLHRTGNVSIRNVKFRPLGMRPLFNGRDLSGWKTYPNLPTKVSVTPEGWMRLQGGRGQVETEETFADFTLQLEIFVNGKNLNSGVFFRCIPGELMNGYESQIHNGYRDNDRTKPVDCGTGGIFRRQNARRVVANDFEWFFKTIHVDGPHMAVWVNGYQVSDWTDTRPPDKNPRRGLRLEAGTIIFQGHDPGTDIMFRNIRIAELPPR